jgi:hypothetical protein
MTCDICQSPISCQSQGCAYNPISVSALDKQVSGDHYKGKAIQPIIYIHANNLGFCEGNVVKYVTRWRDKNGIADLEKAKHYIELLIEMENAPK